MGISFKLRRSGLRGFTLIEVMVAVAIFVVVGALAMGGYNELIKQSDIVERNAKRTRAVQAAIQRIMVAGPRFPFVKREPRSACIIPQGNPT